MVERGLVGAGRDRGRPCAASRRSRVKRTPVAERRRQGAQPRRSDRARDQHGAAASSPATTCARRTCIRRPTRACRAMCAAMSAWSSAMHGCHVFPGCECDRGRREPAMALHGALRRPRVVGRRRRPDREGLDRRVRAVSGAGVTMGIDPQPPRDARRDARARAFRATPKARCSASRGRRRPSP